MTGSMLFAGNRVSDFAAARAWYERLLGGEPAFLPHETEAVWEVGETRYVYIEEDAERAGGSLSMSMVENLDALVAEIASRGIEVTEWEEYGNGVRKAIFRDADGNEISFGAVPAE